MSHITQACIFVCLVVLYEHTSLCLMRLHKQTSSSLSVSFKNTPSVSHYKSMHPHRHTVSCKHTLLCLAMPCRHTWSVRQRGPAPTWLQHPNLQQVGRPLRQPCPGVVVIPSPQLCHTLVLACLCVTGPADAQADIVAGLSLLNGSPSSEGG